MSCCGDYITLLRFENGKPICEFSYDLQTRCGGLSEYLTAWDTETISYDKITKTITIEYATDDLTSDCYCEQKCYDDDTYRGSSHFYEEGIPKHCRCVFVFNGETFELNESYWEIIKNDDSQER
ncbi:MAG: hypothetical protein FWD66_05715 [Paludibacter sp.]|nr:hypothetical protein [Paludibacter sp.]